MAMTSPIFLQESILDLASVNSLESAQKIVTKALSFFPEINHVSLWGNDIIHKRVFLICEFVGEISLADHSAITIKYGEGILGICVRDSLDKIINNTENFTIVPNVITNSVLESHAVREAACVKLRGPCEYPSYLILLSKIKDRFQDQSELSSLRALLSAFLQAYSRIRSEKFELLMGSISEAKSRGSGIEFLQKSCGDIAKAFPISTFSIWMNERDRVYPKHFSDPHIKTSGMFYNLGEGLTGYVAKTGKPVFLNALSDSEEFYGVRFSGKVSESENGQVNNNDRVIIIPLKYPVVPGRSPQVHGVIRFVSAFNKSGFFWPTDFDRAQAVSQILSILLYQETLLANSEKYRYEEKRTSTVLKNLLTLVFKARAGESLDKLTKNLLGEMEKWEGIIKVDIFEPKIQNIDIIEASDFLDKESLEGFKALSEDFVHKVQLSEKIFTWPIRDRNNQYGILLVKFKSGKQYISFNWVQLASLILGSFYAIDNLLEETRRLRSETEEKEMWALAGVISRSYAHEVRNACKWIYDWIPQAQRTAPNYTTLKNRVEEMYKNVEDLLRSTGLELELKKRDFVLFREVKDTLYKLNFRNGTKFRGCLIKLDILGHRHHKVNIDPITLLGILYNLILNAQEQYDIRGKTGPIEIGMIEKEINGILYAGFSVKDYGVGIEENTKQKIFQYGFTTKPKGGKGIGLSIVSKLVESCNGIIVVDSTLGYYTEFRVLYPTI